MHPPVALEPLLTYLEQAEDRVITIQQSLTATRALGPENGGDGEWTKAEYIESVLSALGVDAITHVDAPDSRVSRKTRPNLVVKIPGSTPQTLWLFGHMDVVGAGDEKAWHSNPWLVARDGDWLYGRGVEDNQQAIVSMLLLVEALKKTGTKPTHSLGLVFMADEENGSKYGLGHILDSSPSFFAPHDKYVVPDFGSPDGTKIEIAEKAQLWLRISTKGTQCHASMPHLGKNAFVAGAELVSTLHAELPGLFPQTNPIFSPPCCTFVPTRHDANTEAVNILPGNDVFYLDCRILPDVAPETVLERIRGLAMSVASRHQVKMDVDVVQLQTASSVSMDTPALSALRKAIQAVYGHEATNIGVGGGTVAALLRQKGLPALVWSCLENSCHQPNERSSITATCKDAQVFAHLLMSSDA